ncbi:hypothetical protein Lery_0680 [Legionella erythra]|uniref:Uncharacterized protein n=2 Tax=Legionella erythra TaxID=448 RepID=A0A0W0TTD6_LEGER|nr:hypothetical protein [Legionella erythra]KTC98877.1 hypothetical protein Lery_0680 [Legionella erythra]
MPYISLSMLMDETKKTQGWQLNVALDPSALRPGSAHDKREAIAAILRGIAKKYRVDAHVFAVEEEPENAYDSAIHRRAQEGLSRGKEIILSLPNQDKAFRNLTHERLVLELWSELNKAGVPLHAGFVPGPYPISGPDGLPTPFSVSQNQKQDLNEPHSALFREAAPILPPYPLTILNLPESDLAIYKIKVNAHAMAKDKRESFAHRHSKAMQQLAHDVKTLKQGLWPRIKSFQDSLESHRLSANIYSFQQDKHKKLDSEQELLTLYPNVKHVLGEYPRQADDDFSLHPVIADLRSGILSKQQIAEHLNELKVGYRSQLEAIKADFQRHVRGNNKSSRTMVIDWSYYFPDCTEAEIVQLIDCFPAAMQSLYRRVVLLERERRSHEQFKKQWLKLNYSSSLPYKQLSQLSFAIQQLVRDGEVDLRVVDRFLALHQKIEDELFTHQRAKPGETAFPIVLEHFTALARRLHSKPRLSREEISKFACQLDEDLAAKRLSIGMRVCIAGCIGALLGLVLGFVAGAALTWWGGGFGAIPGAIAGMTLAEGILMGTMGVLMGAELGAAASMVGFFSARAQEASQKAIEQEKQTNKQALLLEMNDVIEAVDEQQKPFEEPLPVGASIVTFQ